MDILDTDPWIRIDYSDTIISFKCKVLEEASPNFGYYLTREDAKTIISLLQEYVHR